MKVIGNNQKLSHFYPQHHYTKATKILPLYLNRTVISFFIVLLSFQGITIPSQTLSFSFSLAGDGKNKALLKESQIFNFL